MSEHALDLLDVWWSLGEKGWFSQSDETDAMLTQHFSSLVADARAGGLDHWKETPHTALALTLLLDQLPRNMFRGKAKAFSSDAQAVKLADEVRAKGFDKAYHGIARSFFYMPYMHAEDIAAQSTCCDIFRQMEGETMYRYALMHMDAIRRFGRFPHRNGVLGRVSTPEEKQYMATGGFAA